MYSWSKLRLCSYRAKKKFRVNKNVKFLIDQFPDYSFDCQVYFALNCTGFLGSPAGVNQLYYFLQKKNIFVNCVSDKFTYLNPEDINQDNTYNKYLFKKLKFEKEYLKFDSKTLNHVMSNDLKMKNLHVLENSFSEIKATIDDYLKKGFW